MISNKNFNLLNTQETVVEWRSKYVGYHKKIHLRELDSPTVIDNTIMVGSDDFDLPGITLELVKMYQPEAVKEKNTKYCQIVEKHLDNMGVKIDNLFEAGSSEFTGDAVDVFPIISKEDFRLSDSYKILDLAYDKVFDGFTIATPVYNSITPIIPFVILFDDEDSNGKNYIKKYNQYLLDILAITYTKHLVCGYKSKKADYYEAVSLIDRNTSKDRYSNNMYGLGNMYFDRGFGYDKYDDAISMRDIKNCLSPELHYEVLTYLGNIPLYQLMINELLCKDTIKG